MNRRVFISIVLVLCIIANLHSQEIFKPRPVPLAVTAMKYKDAYARIIYSQPQKLGREIFGKLVPFGEIWRTGDNEATELTITKDMMINNQPLKAGTYTIFTIPQPDKWTIILNSDVGLWGSYNHVPDLDVMRFDIPVETNTTFYEAFTLTFDQKNEMANLLIMWDRLKLSIPFKFIN
jgi:hypothetical protein